MAITIDWGTRVINVPRNDMTLIQLVPTEIRELNLNSFRMELKGLEDSEDGMMFPDTHRHNTEVSLGGIVYARVVEIINDYTITFEDGQYAVNLVGANSNVGDKVNVNQVSVRTQNSAGLISNAAIEYSSFNNKVWIDTGSSYSGTLFPKGTPQEPVNNLTDALLIASYRGFNTLNLLSNLTIPSGVNVDYLTIKSDDWWLEVTVEAGASCENTNFEKVSIFGVMSGNWNVLTDCWVYTITNFCGWLIGGSYVDITLAPYNPVSLGQSWFDNIVPMYPNEPMIITMNTNTSIACTDLNGIYTIKSLTAGSIVDMGISAGDLILDSSCVGGSVFVKGIGSLIDDSTGVVIDNKGLVNKEQLIKSNWKEVYLNTTSGEAGTEFPIGTINHPSNNITNALSIAAENGINKIEFTGDITLPSSCLDLIFIGSGPTNSNNITLNNQELTNVYFQDCRLTGVLNTEEEPGGGWAHVEALVQFENCSLFKIENLEGIASRCQIEGATKVRAGGWFSSIDTVIEGDNTVFDLQNTTLTSVSMDIDSGWAQFINTVAGCLIELNVKGGEVSFDSSCVGGDYYLEGVGTLFNEGSMTVKENHLTWDEKMSYHPIAGSIGANQQHGVISL